MTLSIEEFILARLDDENKFWLSIQNDENKFWSFIQNSRIEDLRVYHNVVRQIVDWHKNWPVLLQGPPSFSHNEVDSANNMLSTSMMFQMAWATQDSYVKKFGSKPWSAPILVMIADMWSDHPDFDEDWRL